MGIVGALMPAIFALVGASAERGLIAQREAQVTWLAHDLLAEIGARPCNGDEPGLVAGITETLDELLGGLTQGGSRAGYTTVFDYAEWDSYPPVDRNGDPLPGFEGWYRAARVIPFDPFTKALRTNNPNAAMITVTVMGPGGIRKDITMFRTAAMDLLRDTTDNPSDTKDGVLTDLLKELGL